jgi:hypothetical protein
LTNETEMAKNCAASANQSGKEFVQVYLANQRFGYAAGELQEYLRSSRWPLLSPVSACKRIAEVPGTCLNLPFSSPKLGPCVLRAQRTAFVRS